MMNPNVYMAYLCFLKNDSRVYSMFSKCLNSKDPYRFSEFEYAVREVVYRERMKAKRLFIYEAEQLWVNFDTGKFIKFLNDLGLKA